jgi:hypothetical protein
MNERRPIDQSLHLSERLCSKVACQVEATATLTYDYEDSMVVLGPLSPTNEPYSHDLCARHSEQLSVPHGWQIVRHAVLGRIDSGV